MKLNRKLTALAVALATVGATSAATVLAQTSSGSTDSAAQSSINAPGWHRWHRFGPGSMLLGTLLHATQQLNLTTEQQQSIKTLLSNARAQHQANPQTPPDIAVLGNPGDPNYAAAVQNEKTRAASRIDQESQLANQVYNMLTADQKAQLPEVLASMKAKFEQRRAAWQQRHPSGQTSGSGNASGASGNG